MKFFNDILTIFVVITIFVLLSLSSCRVKEESKASISHDPIFWGKDSTFYLTNNEALPYNFRFIKEESLDSFLSMNDIITSEFEYFNINNNAVSDAVQISCEEKIDVISSSSSQNYSIKYHQVIPYTIVDTTRNAFNLYTFVAHNRPRIGTGSLLLCITDKQNGPKHFIELASYFGDHKASCISISKFNAADLKINLAYLCGQSTIAGMEDDIYYPNHIKVDTITFCQIEILSNGSLLIDKSFKDFAKEEVQEIAGLRIDYTLN